MRHVARKELVFVFGKSLYFIQKGFQMKKYNFLKTSLTELLQYYESNHLKNRIQQTTNKEQEFQSHLS